RLAKVKLPVEEIALTSAAQTHKLEVILGQLSQHLGLEEDQTKWSVQLIHNKDLLATVHLLVAMVKRFQPELELPSDVEVEVVVVESSNSGVKIQSVKLTLKNFTTKLQDAKAEAIDPVRRTEAVSYWPFSSVGGAILHFVNTNMSSLGLQVADMGRQ
ncbi:hypothetical protein NL108_003069, partial [Boleophthalmus pectinirostris]